MGGGLPAKIFRAIPLGVLAFGLTLTALDFPFVVALRESAFDQYQKLSPRPYQPLPIRVIAIDEASLDAFGQWPWPRRRLAELTEKLADLGVAAIGFDLLFAEPDRFSPALLAEELEPLPDLRAELEAASADGELPDNDELLADAFLLVPSVVGLALSGEGEAPEVKLCLGWR